MKYLSLMKNQKNLFKKYNINKNLDYDEKSKLPYLITNKNDFFILQIFLQNLTLLLIK